MIATFLTAAGVTLTLDPSQTYGTYYGTGVSLAWWANVMGGTPLSIPLTDLAFNFSAPSATVSIPGVSLPLPTLGLNIARYNVGGSSTQPGPSGRHWHPSPNMPAWKAVPLYWLNNASDDPTSPSWDWEADSRQLEIVLQASQRGAQEIELFSNSPPWWMLTNDNPSGANDGSKDNLLPAFYQPFVRYLVTVAGHLFTKRGLNVTTIEAFNEPVSPWWRSTGTQEGCHFYDSTMAQVLALFPSELERLNLPPTIKVSASDDNRVDEALETWRSLPTSARAAIAQVNTHGYQMGGDRGGLYQAVVVEGGKALRNSEYGEGDGSGATLVAQFLADFSTLHPNGWTYWQLLDVAGGWGPLDMDVSGPSVTRVNTKFFAIAQLSRHLRPGMVSLGGGSVGGVGYASAWGQESSSSRSGSASSSSSSSGGGGGKTLALVLFNPSTSTPASITLDLSKFPTCPDQAIAAFATRVASQDPTPGAAYSPLQGVALKASAASLTIPPNTVISLDVVNC